jgi:hypothetical protein
MGGFRITAVSAACVALVMMAAAQQRTAAPIKVSFARDVQPILSDKCFRCHGPDPKTRAAGLRLDTPEGAFDKRSGMPPIVPGRPDQSRILIRMTEKQAALRMPPPGSHLEVKPNQIETIRRWIAQGAPFEKHWAFVPPKRPEVPQTRRKDWSKGPIDRFILARLEREGLSPSPQADRETLIRRVTMDLTGIPPTPAEVDAFKNDRSPNAYDKVVDRLLASPRFGERMVWDWLDAARYADTNGYQGDRTRPMWPWRDWAVAAINSNMPYDQFTIEQLAGDLLPNPTTQQIIATGFHRNLMLNGEGGRIAEESRVEYVGDRVETTGAVWLGLTINCARCHDHKYDPLTQRDYYSLSAYFNSIDETGEVEGKGYAAPYIPLPTPEQERAIASKRVEISEMSTRLRSLDPESPDRYLLSKRADAAGKELQQLQSQVMEVMVMRERAQPRETTILIRGAYDKPGEKVTHAVPAALVSAKESIPPTRLGLARWLVNPANPLTARVTVNRFWQMLFGTGIVKTSEDFGLQGERPSHPELLDWLATEFVRLKWDVKALLRQIVTSAAYRQSSRVSPALLERDPENRLLARAPRFRMPSWMLRDQALAVSGLLVEKLGGPPVRPYQPEGVWEDFSYGKITYTQDHGDALYRRSLYTFWRRTVAPTTFFDTAARRTCTLRTARTNTPLHALTTLNDTTYVEAARVFAESLMKAAAADTASRIALGFKRLLARAPNPSELSVLVSAYHKAQARYMRTPEDAQKVVSAGEYRPAEGLNPVKHAAMTHVCLLLFNLDEALCRQ